MDKLKKDLPSAIAAMCETSANYDKQLALAIIRLRNGAELEIEGHKIKDPPVTIIEKVAKGCCWQHKLNLDTAEGDVKALDSAIRTTLAQMCGYQSINKFLSEV